MYFCIAIFAFVCTVSAFFNLVVYSLLLVLVGLGPIFAAPTLYEVQQSSVVLLRLVLVLCLPGFAVIDVVVAVILAVVITVMAWLISILLVSAPSFTSPTLQICCGCRRCDFGFCLCLFVALVRYI